MATKKLTYHGPGHILKLRDGTKVPRGANFEADDQQADELLTAPYLHVTEADQPTAGAGADDEAAGSSDDTGTADTDGDASDDADAESAKKPVKKAATKK